MLDALRNISILNNFLQNVTCSMWALCVFPYRFQGDGSSSTQSEDKNMSVSIEVTGPSQSGFAVILTPEALEFVADLNCEL